MCSNSSEQTSATHIGRERLRRPLHVSTGASSFPRQTSSVLIDNQSHETTADPLSRRFSSRNQPSPKSEKKVSIARRLYQSVDANILRHLKKTDSSFTSRAETTTGSKSLIGDKFDQQQYARKDKFTKHDRSSHIDDSRYTISQS
jgi:hypothetical protein